MKEPPRSDVRTADGSTSPDSPEADATLLEQILSWLDQEDVRAEPAPPHAANAFELQLTCTTDVGAAYVALVRPKHRPVLGLLLAVELAPEHRGAMARLGPYERARFRQVLRRTAFAGGRVGFALHGTLDDIAGWELEVALYDDALTQDAFHRALKAILLKHLELVEVVQERLAFGPRTYEGPAPGFE